MEDKEDVTIGNILNGAISKGEVFSNWFSEIYALIREVEARRKFDTEVSEWLKETDRVKDFEAWRKARNIVSTDVGVAPKEP